MGMLIERQHGMNLRKLIEEFGEDKGDEIKDLYESSREIADEISIHSHGIVYEEVRTALRNKYKD